ncbi:hypothetical protein PAXINDRAFT_168205 [Paxillus involutus ATCC 200175]|nr:hypothetical protein PAXINDRAFT_168205 [Paxillus involutus ATCC 200175]
MSWLESTCPRNNEPISDSLVIDDALAQSTRAFQHDLRRLGLYDRLFASKVYPAIPLLSETL